MKGTKTNNSLVLPALTLLLSVLSVSGCVVRPFQSLTDRTYPLWKESAPPPPTLAAPSGFKITPAEAYRVVTAGQPQKFSWYVYADEAHYLLVQHAPLLLPTSGYARKFGLYVDGQTGRCSNCPGQRRTLQ